MDSRGSPGGARALGRGRFARRERGPDAARENLAPRPVDGGAQSSTARGPADPGSRGGGSGPRNTTGGRGSSAGTTRHTLPPPGRPLRPTDPRELDGYQLLRRLGEGGMGTVYLGRSPTGRRVAVKIVREELANDPEYRARFRREAEVARRVARFCTAEVLDAVDPPNRPPYLVTEFVDGPSLADTVATDGPFNSADVERLAISVASALSVIHAAGLVHRDLKPSNVLLSQFGPRVIDFGVAWAPDSVNVTGDLVVGTPAFMAPEQARGERVTSAADIFSWGGLMIFAATGQRPFGGGAVHALLYKIVTTDPDLSGLDPAFADVVRAAMHRDPAMRPTAAELLNRLHAIGAPMLLPPPDVALPVDDEPGVIEPAEDTPVDEQPPPGADEAPGAGEPSGAEVSGTGPSASDAAPDDPAVHEDTPVEAVSSVVEARGTQPPADEPGTATGPSAGTPPAGAEEAPDGGDRAADGTVRMTRDAAAMHDGPTVASGPLDLDETDVRAARSVFEGPGDDDADAAGGEKEAVTRRYTIDLDDIELDDEDDSSWPGGEDSSGRTMAIGQSREPLRTSETLAIGGRRSREASPPFGLLGGMLRMPLTTLISALSVLIALAAVSVAAVAAIDRASSKSSTPAVVELTVPRGLVGLTAKDAEARLAKLGFVHVRREMTPNAAPKGQVLAVRPGEDSRLDSTDTLTLVVSAGLQSIKVPEVVGLTEAAARGTLQDAGLTVSVRAVAAPAIVGVGRVASVDPDAGTQVKAGSTVTITVVATRGTSSTATVPTVAGLAADKAQDALRRAGFSDVAIENVASAEPAGTAIGTDPAAGTSAPKNTTVRLRVSTGPGKTAVPDVVGKAQADATSVLKAAGLDVSVIQDQGPSTLPAGTVEAITPAAGTEIALKSSVTITVVSDAVPVPDTVGLSRSEAERQLGSYGLKVSVSQANGGAAAGTVVSQSPLSGSVPRGATVTIVVVQGSSTTPPPGDGGSTTGPSSPPTAPATTPTGSSTSGPTTG